MLHATVWATLSFDATGRVLPATLMVIMFAADRSWAGVPRKTTSDLSALSWRPFCKNQRRTAVKLIVDLHSLIC